MNPTHIAVAVAMVFGLAACGGGGSSSPTSENPDPNNPTPTDPTPTDPDVATKAVNGMVAPTAKGATICLDEDRSLACEADEEWWTTVGAGGGYTLDVPEDTVLAESLIVGQFAADSPYGAAVHNDMVPPAPFTLATPASEASQMGVLSTLVAIRLQANPTLTPEDALALVRTDLGLPDDGAGVDPAQVQRLETAALPALRQAANAGYIAGGSADLGAATVAAAPSLNKVLTKYIDPATLALWPLVGEKTLVSETVSDAAPQACGIQPVEVMRITTPGGVPIVSKDDYIEDATISFDPGTAYPAGMSATTEIRGRGNTTWNHPQYVKKPYRIKLPKPGLPLLGMPEARNWAILANHSDKSGLRNALAFCLGKQMNLDFSHPWRFIELYLNGEYQGVYQITAHTEAHENRVDIGPVWPEEDQYTPGAGYLLEMDARAPAENEVWFWSEGVSSTDYTNPQRPFAIKSDTVGDPHDPATADVKAQYIAQAKADIDAMEDAFLDPDPVQRVARASADVDMEELIDFYLINEFLRNGDAFWSSTYLHRASNDKLKFGPLWDFDLSAGNDDGVKDARNPAEPSNDNGNWCPQGWFTRWVSSDYIWPLLENGDFRRLLVARWEYLSRRLAGNGADDGLWHYIDQASTNMADAQARNFGLGGPGEPVGKGDLSLRVWPNWVVLPTYQQEVDYLKDWLQERANWMDVAIPDPARDYSQNPLCDAAQPGNWIEQWNPGWAPGAAPSP